MLDMQTLVPGMFLVILIVMLIMIMALSVGKQSIGQLFATSASSVLVTLFVLIVILFSITTGMGFGGWMGIKMTPPSFSAPTIIMTLAVADSIHFLVTFFIAMRKGMSRHDAVSPQLAIKLWSDIPDVCDNGGRLFVHEFQRRATVS